MSVYACRQLPDDWMACPMSPVLSAGGTSSLNFDNYDDQEQGAVQIVNNTYPNVPPIFNTVRTAVDQSDLMSKYGASDPGDVVYLTDGTWTLSGVSLFTRSGTVDNPIYILAQTPGGVTVNAGDYQLKFTGSHHVLGGITFGAVSADNNGTVWADNSFFRMTCCSFPAYNYHAFYFACTVARTGIEIDNCIFDSQNNSNSLATVQVLGGTFETHAKHKRFHHNEHRNISSSTLDDASALWLGTTAAPGYTIIENSIFENLDGDPEILSNKEGYICTRHNIFDDCNGAIVQRFAGNSLVYGNWINRCNMLHRTPGPYNTTVFNYCLNRSFDKGTSMYNASGAYLATDNNIWRYNVMSNIDELVNVYTADVGDYTRMSGLVLSDNHIYTQSGAQQDAGNYSDSAGDSEASFRSNNPGWGVNTYYNYNLASSPAINAGLFSGPGATLPGRAETWGQAIEIHAPSWWA